MPDVQLSAIFSAPSRKAVASGEDCAEWRGAQIYFGDAPREQARWRSAIRLLEAAALRARGRARAAAFSWPETAGSLLRAIAEVETYGYRRPRWGGLPISAGAPAP